MSPWAEASLFAAARAEHVERSSGRRSRAARRRLRPLRRLLGRLPGRRARPRDRAVLELNLRRSAASCPTGRSCSSSTRTAAARARASADRIEREGRRSARGSTPATGSSRRAFPERIACSTGRSAATRSRRERRCLSVRRDRRADRGEAAAPGRRREGPAHAYLFHGPAGVGSGRRRSRSPAALLGDRGRVERHAHPDLYVLEPLGDQIRIDEIRALRRDLHMRPFEADRRVYLVVRAHLMNADAADALLKDLEEPPATRSSSSSPTSSARCRRRSARAASSSRSARSRSGRCAPSSTRGPGPAGASDGGRARRRRQARPRRAAARPGGGRASQELLAVARAVYARRRVQPGRRRRARARARDGGAEEAKERRRRSSSGST